MLGRSRRNRTDSDIDVDVDMVPIMNMFLVLIPFLLISANFIHLRVINTSVPVLAASESEEAAKKSVKITAVVELGKDGIRLSAISDEVAIEELGKWSSQLKSETADAYPLEAMTQRLREIKESFPASDTVIIVPDQEIIYEAIIEVMDSARYYSKKVPLFPNVVLSGKVE